MTKLFIQINKYAEDPNLIGIHMAYSGSSKEVAVGIDINAKAEDVVHMILQGVKKLNEAVAND